MSKTSNSGLARVLYLLAEIQNHLRNGVIQHELSQIVRHTRDKEILDVCNRAAECLGIELETTFSKLNEQQLNHSLRTLFSHLGWAKARFDEIVKLVPECDFEWIDSPFKATEFQLLSLSNYFILIDKVPDTTDIEGEVIRVADLVAVLCKDDEGRDYEHYGIVISSPKGFRVAHFFTGTTVQAQNSLVEKGFGYIHEVNYEPKWAVKQHLPSTIPYSQVEQRIKESRKLDTRIWNKLTYNCEHWAREMFDGQPSCTQLQRWKQEIRSAKQAKDSV